MSLEQRLRELVEKLYVIGEAVTGSDAAAKLAEELRRILDAKGVAPHYIKFPVVTWLDKGAYVECGRVVIKASTLPQTLGGIAEGRLVEVHCTDPYCFNHVGEGDIVLARLPEDPDDVTTLYVQCLERGASALIVYDRWPGRFRRIVVSGRWDYSLLPSPAPMLAVHVRREDGEWLARHCLGCKIRVESNVEVKESVGRIIEVLIGEGRDWEVVINAHYDHWLGGAGDNLAAVATVLEAVGTFREAKNIGIRIAIMDAEEFGDPAMPAWYWSYGARWYTRMLFESDLLDSILAVLNLDMLTSRRLYLAATPELQKALHQIAVEQGFDIIVEDCETCYSDGYQYASYGLASATFYNIDDYLEFYHTDLDKPHNLDYSVLAAMVKVLERFVKLASEHGLRILDYMGYVEKLELLAREAPLEVKRSVYAFAEEARLLMRRGEYNKLLKACRVLTSGLCACVFKGDYKWDTGPFKPQLAPRLQAVIESLKLIDALRAKKVKIDDVPGDYIVPGAEEHMATPLPQPVKTWVAKRGLSEKLLNILESMLRASLLDAANQVANVILQAYQVLKTS